MRRWIVTGLILALAPAVSWAGDLEELDWIIGTWKRESRRGEIYETWERLSGRTVQGDSWIVSASDGERHPLESLLLVEMAGEVFYIPKVSENEYPVPFRLTSMGPGRAVFENPTHDFPQKIIYQRTGDNELKVTIEGPGDGEESRQVDFEFSRAESASWPTEDWPRSSLKEQGLDAKPINQLVETIRENREIRNIHSLLVVRNGWLVLEEYFGDHDAEELHELQSVSKSFTSALVGIAIADGKIEGVDEKVLSFFPDMEGIDNLDDRKREMTLEDLLTMRSGTDYHERGSDSPHSQLNRKASGWTRFILDRPMIAEPGTSFRYDSGAVILTSAILRERYGVHADDFAVEHLFAPLGIDRFYWYKNAEGHPHTGGGLSLRSQDMAKFGLLYMRDGRWDDKQVLPATWVATSLSRHVEFERSRGRSVGYGYWWWVLPPDPDGEDKRDIYGAFGFKGQYIFLVPEHDMIVVVTAGGSGWAEESAPREFLYSHILKAVH